MDFRERIRRVLAENPDWSIREVSLRAGSDSMLHKVLNPDKRGGIKNPTIEKIEEIAAALHVSPAWLAFGEPEQVISEELLREMIEEAVAEVAPGMTIGQIQRAVASSLRERLKLHLSVGATPGNAAGETAPDTIAQSPAPTKRAEKAGSRRT